MRGVLSLGGKLAVTVGLVGLFLWKIGPGSLVEQFRSADPKFLILGGVFFLLSNVLGTFQWRVLLHGQKIRLPFRQVLSLYFVGVFFNNFLISNMGGDVIRGYQIRRASGQGSAGLASILLDRFIGLFALTCLALIAYFFAPRLDLALLPFLLIIVGGLGCLLIVWFNERLGKLSERAVRRIMPQWIGDKFSSLRDALIAYRSQVRTLGLAFLISLGVQVLRVGLHYGAGLALNVKVGFPYFLVIVPLTALVAAIPISFGGIGVRESVGVLMFRPVGVPAETAFSLLLLGYIVGMLASSPGGLVFLLKRTYGPEKAKRR